MCFHADRRGAILIISLWILAILSIFAISIGHRLSLQIKLLHNYLDSTKAYYIAKAGIEKAIAVKAQQITVYADSYAQPWLNDEKNFKDVKFSEGVYTVRNCDVPGLYGMSDEQSKININEASFEVLSAFLKNRLADDNLANNIAAAIVDWKDADSVLTTLDPATNLLIGAENNVYQALEIPYNCKDPDFDAIEEVMLVKGMTPEIFYGEDVNKDGIIDSKEEGIKRFITVYGDGSVNINTALEDVLKAVFMDCQSISFKDAAKLADYIKNFRQGASTGPGAENWFIAVTNYKATQDADKIKNLRDDNTDATLSDTEWNKLRDAEQKKSIGTTSLVYRINSQGSVRGINKSIEAVIEFDADGEYEIKYWDQR